MTPLEQACVDIFEKLMNQAMMTRKIDRNTYFLISQQFQTVIGDMVRQISSQYPDGIPIETLKEIVRKVINDIHKSITPSRPMVNQINTNQYINPFESNVPVYDVTNNPFMSDIKEQPPVIQPEPVTRPVKQVKLGSIYSQDKKKSSILKPPPKKRDIKIVSPEETINGIHLYKADVASTTLNSKTIGLKEGGKDSILESSEFSNFKIKDFIINTMDVRDSTMDVHKITKIKFSTDEEFYYTMYGSSIEYLYHLFAEMIDFKEMFSKHMNKINVIFMDNKNMVYEINYRLKIYIRHYVSQLLSGINSSVDIIDKNLKNSKKDKALISLINDILKYNIRFVDHENLGYYGQIEELSDLSDLAKAYYRKNQENRIVDHLIHYLKQISNGEIISIDKSLVIFNSDFPFPEMNQEIISINHPTFNDLILSDIVNQYKMVDVVFNESVVRSSIIFGKSVIDENHLMYSVI